MAGHEAPAVGDVDKEVLCVGPLAGGAGALLPLGR